MLNDKDWLRGKYEKEGLSTNAIAELVGVKTPNSVRQALLRHGIKVRSVSDGLTYGREDDGFIINKSVLTGCLLGDAYLSVYNKRSDCSYPCFRKKNKHQDHVEFVAELMFVDKSKAKIKQEGRYV